MKFVHWGEKQTERLNNAHWMLNEMDALLKIQALGGIQIAAEGYLLGEPFGRGITMSAYVAAETTPPGGVMGAKWVSSRVANLKEGLPRGRSVTMLNAGDTGLPLLVFDGTDLSNARTAIFNIAAIDRCGPPPKVLGLLAAGRVHQWLAKYARQVWGPDLEIVVYDPDADKSLAFAEEIGGKAAAGAWVVLEAEVVSVATSGADQGWIAPEMFSGRLFLNTSLRDVTRSMFLVGENGSAFPLSPRVVVDDVELAAQQETPFHQASRLSMQYPPVRLCDVPAAWRQHEQRTIVNPMGCAGWDVGLGYAIWKEVFTSEAELQERVPPQLDFASDATGAQ
jgi:ornithine cyclodeaminase/alanine dehydrogenase-like protein (mu-crystallin family)